MELLFFEITDGFSLFIGAMLEAPLTIFQVPYMAIGLIIFAGISASTLMSCNWFIKRFQPHFIEGTLLTTLVISFIGVCISFPLFTFRFFENVFYFGPPSLLLNVSLGAITYWCIRLKDTYPTTGFLALCGIGFFFTWSLYTSLTMFVTTLFI